MTKELEFIKRAVLKACNPHWDWEAIEKKDIKHIGQPVGLARVLIALDWMGKYGSWIAIDSKGYIYDVLAGRAGRDIDCESINIETSEKACKWNLNEDLDQQETETILSISKLLGYEN